MNAILLTIALLAKKLLILIILLQPKKLNRVMKLLNLKLVTESEFSKVYTKIWLSEIFVVDSVLKTVWTFKVKDLNEYKTIGSSNGNEL